MKRVYIAGPITGVEQLNRPAFEKTAARLRELGWDVVEPFEVCASLPDGSPWSAYMRLCIPALLTCDCVALLPGWEHSRGAKLEHHNARAFGMPCFPAEHMAFSPAKVAEVLEAFR